MKEPYWVLQETVLALHERLLFEFGGPSGIRDQAMLDSALSRPQNLFIYGEPTFFELAASYTFGLIKNHPFIDGNKRIGFATCVTFMRLNGYAFSANEVDAVIQTLALAAGELDESGYAKWLEKNSKYKR